MPIESILIDLFQILIIIDSWPEHKWNNNFNYVNLRHHLIRVGYDSQEMQIYSCVKQIVIQ